MGRSSQKWPAAVAHVWLAHGTPGVNVASRVAGGVTVGPLVGNGPSVTVGVSSMASTSVAVPGRRLGSAVPVVLAGPVGLAPAGTGSGVLKPGEGTEPSTVARPGQ